MERRKQQRAAQLQRARFGTALATLQTAAAARDRGMNVQWWGDWTPQGYNSSQFYEPYHEKVNWKKEGF